MDAVWRQLEEEESSGRLLPVLPESGDYLRLQVTSGAAAGGSK